MSERRTPEISVNEKGETIVTLRTPLPPAIAALDAEGQRKFCEYIDWKLKDALNRELRRHADAQFLAHFNRDNLT